MKLVLLLTTGVWLGLVIGLSFIEAPLKFQAPGITTELGLGIGRLVFGVLNKIEIVFSIFFLAALFRQFKSMNKMTVILMVVMIVIIFIQTIFLFPALNERIAMRLSSEMPPDSNLHFIYIILEVIKLPVLITLFIKTFHS